MKTILLLLALLLAFGFASADLAKDLESMKESLAPALEECSNVEAFRYGDKIAIRQFCPFVDRNAYGETLKTIIIDVTNKEWKRLSYRHQLLD